MRACVRACVRECVRACVRACVCVLFCFVFVLSGGIYTGNVMNVTRIDEQSEHNEERTPHDGLVTRTSQIDRGPGASR